MEGSKRRKRSWRLTVRGRIIAVFSALVVVIVLFQVFFFPGRYAQRARTALEEKATAVCQLVAHSSTSAIEFEDPALGKEILTGASRDKEILYLALVLADGKLFATHNAEELPDVASLIGRRGQHIDYRGNEMVLSVPIETRGGASGTLIAGFSTELIAEQIRQNRLMTLLIGLMVLGLGIGVATWIGTYVRKHIRTMEKIAEQVAETAVQIQAASREMVASSKQQERGASQQASAVEETRRTMDSLLAASGRITETAHNVLANAQVTQRTNQTIAERIRNLTEHTQRITDILEVIKDIANKSELLALNAALEGTKAGEAGRGFSLVANHMQRLAENVMGSVRDIQALTVDIRDATNASVLATEEGTKLAADTTQSADQISLITQQQQSGTEQVSKAMDDVATIAGQIVSGSKEAVTAIQLLLELSERSEGLVRQFKAQVEATGESLP